MGTDGMSKGLTRGGVAFADEDQFLHATPGTLSFGSVKQLGEDALAPMVWVDHAGTFFLCSAKVVNYEITDEGAIVIVEKIVGSVTGTAALHLLVEAHMQVFVGIAEAGKLIYVGNLI